MLVAVVGAKGSPGTSTFALALSASLCRAQREVVLCEADEDGGDLAIRLGVPAEPGLIALAADSRHGYDDRVGIANATRLLGGSLSVITAPARPSVARTVIEQTAMALAQHARANREQFLVVDAGRLRSGGAAAQLVDAAECVLVVCRPSADSVLHLEDELSIASRERVELVIVGDRPSRPEEVQELLGVRTSTSLPLEAKAIEALYGGAIDSERLHRRLYMRAVDSIAQRLLARNAVVDINDRVVTA